jgi:hypothetical protein
MYLVKYRRKWLKQGKLDINSPRIYFHPSAALKAAEGFERKNPMYAGDGMLIRVVRGRTVSRVPIL